MAKLNLRESDFGYKSGDRYYGGLPAEPEYEGPGKRARYWKELIQYFKTKVREYPEYYVIGTSPVAVTLKTPDGKETIDLTKFDALADADEAIEMASHYFDESLFEARKKKKNGALINPDAGNVEHNIEMFNKMNSPVDGPSNNPISGPFGGDVGGGEAMGESLNESTTKSLRYQFLDETYEYDELMDIIFSFRDTSDLVGKSKSELINFILDNWDMWDFQEEFESWTDDKLENTSLGEHMSNKLDEKIILDEKTFKAVKSPKQTFKNVASSTGTVDRKATEQAIANEIGKKSTTEQQRIAQELAKSVPPEKIEEATQKLKAQLDDKVLTDYDKAVLKEKTNIDPEIIEGADTVFEIIDSLLSVVGDLAPIVGGILDILELLPIDEVIAGAPTGGVGAIITTILSVLPQWLLVGLAAQWCITGVQTLGRHIKDAGINMLAEEGTDDPTNSTPNSSTANNDEGNPEATTDQSSTSQQTVDKKEAVKAAAEKYKDASPEEKVDMLKKIADNIPTDKIQDFTKKLKSKLSKLDCRGLTHKEKEILKTKTNIDPKIIDGADTVLEVLDTVLDLVQAGVLAAGVIIDVIHLAAPDEVVTLPLAATGWGAVIVAILAALSYIPESTIIAVLVDLGITAVRGVGALIKTGAVHAVGALSKKKNVTEGVNNEKIELEYKDLKFTQCGAMRDVDDWDEWDRCVDWTYEVDKDDLYTFIFEMCIDETDFPLAFEDEFDPNNADDWNKFESWLDANFDSIFNKYENKILANWEEEAAEEASAEYDPDDYVDWDSMPGGYDDRRDFNEHLDDLMEGESVFMEKYSMGLTEEYKREARLIDYFEQMNGEDDEA